MIDVLLIFKFAIFLRLSKEIWRNVKMCMLRRGFASFAGLFALTIKKRTKAVPHLTAACLVQCFWTHFFYSKLWWVTIHATRQFFTHKDPRWVFARKNRCTEKFLIIVHHFKLCIIYWTITESITIAFPCVKICAQSVFNNFWANYRKLETRHHNQNVAEKYNI